MTERQKALIPSNIPLQEIPQLIIEKHRGYTKNGLPLPISNQKANMYLKGIWETYAKLFYTENIRQFFQ